MKKLILFGFMLIGASLCQAQKVRLITDKSFALTIGVDNRIRYNPNLPQEDIEVTSNGIGGATITYIAKKQLWPQQNDNSELSDNYYEIRVQTETKEGEKCIITFKNKKTGEELYKREFRVAKPEEPYVQLNGREGGKIGEGELKSQLGLYAPEVLGFDKCRIERFTLTYTAPGQKPVSCENIGAKFGYEAFSILQKAKTGATYQFTDIQGSCDGVDTKFNDMTFDVK
jgi:hypothetical protein